MFRLNLILRNNSKKNALNFYIVVEIAVSYENQINLQKIYIIKK